MPVIDINGENDRDAFGIHVLAHSAQDLIKGA